MNIRIKDVRALKDLIIHVKAITDLTHEFNSSTDVKDKLELLKRRANIIDLLMADPQINKFLSTFNNLIEKNKI